MYAIFRINSHQPTNPFIKTFSCSLSVDLAGEKQNAKISCICSSLIVNLQEMSYV